MERDVSFFSDGESIAGVLYLPDGTPKDRLPALLYCPGWGGQRNRHSAEICAGLAAAGFATLAFDFRGYGKSGGRHDRLIPTEQVLDIKAGVAFLATQEEVDPTRIATLGLLTGASAGLQAASEDPAIAAVAAFFPFGDGERWLRSLRGAWEWREFIRRVDADRSARSRTGVSEKVDSNLIFVRGPDAPPTREHPLVLASADAILSFKPEDHIHRIAPRPVLVVAVEDDVMMPLDEVRRLYDRLPGPKDLLLVPGGHHDIYRDEVLHGVVDDVARHLHSFLGG